MRKLREIAGYAPGGLMFVLLIPTLMWWVSGMPNLLAAPVARIVIALVLAVIGLSLSVWSIVYMRHKGNGNPMLTGSFVYFAGVCVWLWTWQALLVYVAFIVIMLLQVRSEEKRLRRDFGEEYEAYCRRTGRFGPVSLKK